ncbi:energy transducer TonB [Methylopila musalis]|uniref:energy transducer TonB n=1 Tax=Methylopila musalis TaxID=1134781 RepID=UPI00366F9540
MHLVRCLALGIARLSLLASPATAAGPSWAKCSGDVVNTGGVPEPSWRDIEKYHRTIVGMIMMHMRPPGGAYLIRGRGRTVVRFTLDRTGKLLRAEVAKTSGSASFDREAVKIVRRASDWFPAMPAGYPCAQKSFSQPISFSQRGM